MFATLLKPARRYVLLLLSLSAVVASGQWRWMDPLKEEQPVIQNQGWSDEIGHSFTRLPQRAKDEVREELWELSRHSAGLAIHFYSNAPEIEVQYAVKGTMSMAHMPATGVSGVDLYSINSDGVWQLHYGGRPSGDTIRYHFRQPVQEKYHRHGREFRLYLPLYNEVDWMKIGVPDTCEFAFLPVSLEKPIVLYGTSIAQGACASRPAMAWSSVVQRRLDYPLINLGFSGNGRLEKEMIRYLSELDARLYILDCLPNLEDQSEAEVIRRIQSSVRGLRETHQTPILLVEHSGLSHAETGTEWAETIDRLNRASRIAFDRLQQEGVKDLHYITRQEIGIPADGWVDLVHPNDVGAMVQATSMEKKIRDILSLPVGALTTQQPVSQRREPDMYEWKERHQLQLKHHLQEPPRAIVLGNSIVHYWGGDTSAPRQNGAESWEQVMRRADYHNQGCGWDRIENLLWRVYHDELSGFQAEEVVVMIGTNNLDFNSDEEIVAGIRFLLGAIRQRQPRARLRLVALLPRRDKELRIKQLNRQLQQMAQEEKWQFVNPGLRLLQTNGRIDESLFLDGLHPNGKGYAKLVKEIAGEG